MLKGNKGEWSEVYTLLKLLSEKKLFIGDENLNRLTDIFYPILHILRSESNGKTKYSIQEKDVIVTSDGKTCRVSIKKFEENAKLLLNIIKSKSKGTFTAKKIEEFMAEIFSSSLKANSSSKTDIQIIIHDIKTNQNPTLGFSIKSQLGGASTLLNAGRTTNFVYELTDSKLLPSEIDNINSINISKGKILKRISTVLDRGCKLKFLKTEKEVFNNNLTLIDSCLPKILSVAVLYHYAENLSGLSDIVKKLEEENPLNYNTSSGHNFYEYKIKRFLTDVALGMMPSKVWDGDYDATGGYLIVKNDGEIVCYHVYKKNEFENYLLSNTYLETAGSTRHGFGKIYLENKRLFLNLNLQVRFKK